MAEKVKVIATNPNGQDIPFFTKTLTAEFPGKDGQTYKISIQEPGKTRVEIGSYTVGGDNTEPPICGAHSHWDGGKCVCDPGFHDENGTCVPDVAPHECPPGQHWDGTACVLDVVEPPGNVIYDSNTDGQWANGVPRIVKGKDGNTSPNGKGIFTAASGSPEVHIDGQGTARLITRPGFGR